MHLQQIRYFLVLCEELNFTRAARRCGVSQPSLTGCIRRLESELGLFARKPKVTMTRLGREMNPYFERIARETQEALDAARSFAKHGFRQKVNGLPRDVKPGP
jgi:LysR family transcriptional regulator, hydrogen peroxide-inducible genes activator